MHSSEELETGAAEEFALLKLTDDSVAEEQVSSETLARLSTHKWLAKCGLIKLLPLFAKECITVNKCVRLYSDGQLEDWFAELKLGVLDRMKLKRDIIEMTEARTKISVGKLREMEVATERKRVVTPKPYGAKYPMPSAAPIFGGPIEYSHSLLVAMDSADEISSGPLDDGQKRVGGRVVYRSRDEMEAELAAARRSKKKAAQILLIKAELIRSKSGPSPFPIQKALGANTDQICEFSLKDGAYAELTLERSMHRVTHIDYINGAAEMGVKRMRIQANSDSTDAVQLILAKRGSKRMSVDDVTVQRTLLRSALENVKTLRIDFLTNHGAADGQCSLVYVAFYGALKYNSPDKLQLQMPSVGLEQCCIADVKSRPDPFGFQKALNLNSRQYYMHLAATDERPFVDITFTKAFKKVTHIQYLNGLNTTGVKTVRFVIAALPPATEQIITLLLAKRKSAYDWAVRSTKLRHLRSPIQKIRVEFVDCYRADGLGNCSLVYFGFCGLPVIGSDWPVPLAACLT